MNYDVNESGFLVHNLSNLVKKDYEDRYKNGFLDSIPIKEATFIYRLLKDNNIRYGSSILDLACGCGRYSIIFDNYEYYGVDFSKEGISKAKKVHPNKKFINCCADNIPFKSELFDFILCIGSLEHFPSMGNALNEVYRLLKPSGIIYIELPNLFFLGYYLRYFFLKKTPWSGQLFERLGGIDSYSNLFKKHKFVIKKYFGRNYKNWKCFNPLFQLIWNLGNYFLPAHIKENHCFILKKG